MDWYAFVFQSSDLKGGGDDETRDQYWDAEAENVDLDRERDARDRRKVRAFE